MSLQADIAEFLRQRGFTSSVDGEPAILTPKDYEMVLDKTASRLYSLEDGDSYQVANILAVRTGHLADVYVRIGEIELKENND